MEDKYELKQVRIQLRNSMPLYSSEKIDSPENAVKVMSEVLAPMIFKGTREVKKWIPGRRK